MAEPASNGRPLGERLALAALGALSTSTSPAELRAMLGDLRSRPQRRERLGERAGDALTDLYRELGLVSRDKYEAGAAARAARAPVATARARAGAAEADLSPTRRPRGAPACRASDPIGGACNATAMATRSAQRNIGRLSEIAQVAVRLRLLLRAAQADGPVRPLAARRHARGDVERGRHLREMLDELGPRS